MKKITFALIGIFSIINLQAQTFTTGMIELSDNVGTEYSIQIDVESTGVTLTMIAPSGKWFGLGFGSPFTTGGLETGMVVGNDVVIFLEDPDDGDLPKLTDRYFGLPSQTVGSNGQGIIPSLDERDDWELISNDVVDGVRTIVATRDLDTGNEGDYVFSTSDTNIDLVWAMARDLDEDGIDFFLDWHGNNRGITMSGITLSQQEVQLNSFRISPNPSKDIMTITLPNLGEVVTLEVFDVLGKRIVLESLNELRSNLDVSKWNNGVYLVRISTDSATHTKRFVKQ